MKLKKLITIAAAGFILAALPCRAQVSPAEPFLGMWALDLDYENNHAGWLEVRQEKDYLDAEILWRWGSVYPVDFVFVEEEHLFLTHSNEVVRKKDGKGHPVRTQHLHFWFDIIKGGEDRIEGMAFFPNGNGLGVEKVAFTGKRIPPCGKAPETGSVSYGKPVRLFNGRNLDGWELLDPGAVNGWRVEEGILVNDPVQHEGEEHIPYGNLRTKETFEDFFLTLEVNIPAGSNSGIYLRGIYEVQVQDTYGKELNPHNMGALYSRITPSVAAEKPAGQWQRLEITLYKRHLTVLLNGKNIIDNQPVKGVTGGAMTSDEFSPGPIYLQGDHGEVRFRNIVLTPIQE